MATVLEPNLARGGGPESSDRSFGFVFAAVFVLVGLWPLIHWATPRWWALGVATAFALVAFVRPATLRPLNQAWLVLGRVMHRVVGPLIMGVIFFAAVTPTAWIMRLMGKDVLSLKRRSDLASYWIARAPAEPDATTMKHQ